MKKLRALLFSNISWKLLALCLSFSLWLVCINVVNPIATRNYANNLTIMNLDVVERNGYVLLNKEELENQIITIIVQAPIDSFSTFNQSMLVPYIDVSPIDYLHESSIGMNQPVNVNVNRTGHANTFNPVSVETNPLTVNLRLDRIESIEKPITVNITGTPAESYVALNAHVSPEFVVITGPSTVLNRISTVAVNVDVANATENIIALMDIHILDIDRRDITETVSVNIKRLNVTVPIDMYAQIPIIPVSLSDVGKAADGYEITRVSMDMDFIEVVGQEEDIKKTPYVRLHDIDANGITETTKFPIDLREVLIDTGLSIANGTPNEVIVTVTVEAHTQKDMLLAVPRPEIIGLSEGLELKPIYFGFSVRGFPADIDAFGASDITNVTVNLTGLQAGVHNVVVDMVLPTGIYLAAEPIAEVEIIETALIEE